MERNNKIFRDTAVTTYQVALKVKALLGELVATNSNVTNEATPNKEEHIWFYNLHSPLLTKTKKIRVGEAYSACGWGLERESRAYGKWRGLT